jgi:steroid 5-alpha reductase family enzyme
MTEILLLTAYTSLILFVITFLFAVLLRNNGIVDILWGLGFVVIAWVAYGFAEPNLAKNLILAYVTVWGARLAIHIATRNWGKGEDFRYKQMRESWGRHWVTRSFFQVFLLQWLLMQLVSVPIVIGLTGKLSISPLLLILGMIIWLTGFFFEAVGDYQLSVFKKKKSSKGKLMTTGLWSLTRHPNYFGEATLWWGVALLAFGLSKNIYVFLGPITIDLLLLYVSGIPMLEKKYEGRADWREYAKKTPSFFPKLKVG